MMDYMILQNNCSNITDTAYGMKTGTISCQGIEKTGQPPVQTYLFMTTITADIRQCTGTCNPTPSATSPTAYMKMHLVPPYPNTVYPIYSVCTTIIMGIVIKELKN